MRTLRSPPAVRPQDHARPAAMVALLLAALLAGGCDRRATQGEASVTPDAVVPAPSPAANMPVNAHLSGSGISSGPAWRELSAQQRRALVPLASDWARLSDVQRRNWLAMAEHFDTLSAEEKQKLQGRMAEWIALSPQQRAQARLNFGEAQRLAPDDKRAKWEAYQALTPEERRQLAKNARPRPPATAAPVKPVPSDKLVVIPRSAQSDARPPRIVLSAPDGSTGYPHGPAHATTQAPAPTQPQVNLPATAASAALPAPPAAATPAPAPAPAPPLVGPAPGDVEAP